MTTLRTHLVRWLLPEIERQKAVADRIAYDRFLDSVTVGFQPLRAFLRPASASSEGSSEAIPSAGSRPNHTGE